MGALLVLGFMLRWVAIGMVTTICTNAIGTLVVVLVFGQIRSNRLGDVMIMMPFYIPFYDPILGS